jgi:hypothetical protein
MFERPFDFLKEDFDPPVIPFGTASLRVLKVPPFRASDRTLAR